VEPDPQRHVRGGGRLRDRALGLVPLAEKQPSPGQQDLARPGQPDCAVVALEEPCPQRGLQQPDLPAQGGLGDEEPLVGGPGEAESSATATK
jgi:hypothetical protein